MLIESYDPLNLPPPPRFLPPPQQHGGLMVSTLTHTSRRFGRWALSSATANSPVKLTAMLAPMWTPSKLSGWR